MYTHQHGQAGGPTRARGFSRWIYKKGTTRDSTILIQARGYARRAQTMYTHQDGQAGGRARVRGFSRWIYKERRRDSTVVIQARGYARRKEQGAIQEEETALAPAPRGYKYDT